MKDLTQGPVKVHLLRMSGAFLLNSLMATLFSLVNLYWLGRLGAPAQAAVTLAAIPIMLLLTLLPILNMGSGILIAHSVGAGDRERANRIFNEVFGVSMLFTALIGGIAWINREAFGHLMTADRATAALMATYFRWFIPSIVVQIPLFVMAGALEFTGNVRTGTLAQSGTVALNAILAPLLMFGWLGMPRLGIDGAGLASFIACAATMLGLACHAARKNSYLSLRPGVWLARPRELWRALKIGLPTGIESGVVALYLALIALLLRPFGADEQAAFGIGQRVFQAGLMPLMALSGATCVLVGQNYGANSAGRVRETLRASLLFALFAAPTLLLLFESLAPWVCSRFSDDDAVIAAGTVFLRIGALGLIPASFAYVVFAVLSGMGNTKASLYTQLVYAGMVVVPACALSQLPGFKPVWLWTVMLVAGALQALMAWYFLGKEFGRKVEALELLPNPALGLARS
jgi:putative MATE family efflux protein